EVEQDQVGAPPARLVDGLPCRRGLAGQLQRLVPRYAFPEQLGGERVVLDEEHVERSCHCHSTSVSEGAGMNTSKTAPPSLCAVIVPSRRRTMSCARARPKPCPPPLVLQ